MATERFNFGTLVQRCGLPDYKIRYRINQLTNAGKKIGNPITATFVLYSQKDVNLIMSYGKSPSN